MDDITKRKIMNIAENNNDSSPGLCVIMCAVLGADSGNELPALAEHVVEFVKASPVMASRN